MIRDRRRRQQAAAYAPDALAAQLRAEADVLRASERDVRNELSAALTSLAAERRTVREQRDQLRAAAAIVAAAERECGEKCAHARVAAEQRVQLAAMQERLDVFTNASVQRDRLEFAARDVGADWEPRPTVPRQRGTT